MRNCSAPRIQEPFRAREVHERTRRRQAEYLVNLEIPIVGRRAASIQADSDARERDSAHCEFHAKRCAAVSPSRSAVLAEASGLRPDLGLRVRDQTHDRVGLSNRARQRDGERCQNESPASLKYGSDLMDCISEPIAGE